MRLAESLNLCYRHTGDLLFSKTKSQGDVSSQLTFKRLVDQVTNYLDLTVIIGNNNRLYPKLYDKRDDFDFHIINFPFLSSITVWPIIW